jgi:hypothetical protein
VTPFSPNMGAEWLRIAKGGFDCEMILERDFPLHAFSRNLE